MYYNVLLNYKKIRSLGRKSKLTYDNVGKLIRIDKEHFGEKDNWYYIDGLIQYFKKRNDSRIIGELLSDSILKMHGFVPAVYEIVNLNNSIGLLSPNVNRENFIYESVATMHKLFPNILNQIPIDSKSITIKKILNFMKDKAANYDELEGQIIRKYIIDWFTNQLDYNIRNMVFEKNSDGDVNLARIIDSESSFGATKKGLNDDISKIWIPAIPAEDEDFRTGPYKLGEYDANLLWIILEYPEHAIPLLTEITDSNYTSIINQYKRTSFSSQIVLGDDAIDYLKRFVDKKQEEAENMKKIL